METQLQTLIVMYLMLLEAGTQLQIQRVDPFTKIFHNLKTFYQEECDNRIMRFSCPQETKVSSVENRINFQLELSDLHNIFLLWNRVQSKS